MDQLIPSLAALVDGFRPCFRAEVFAGYRVLSLDESLSVTEFITALPGNPNDPAGTFFPGHWG